ncbi:hypothetical protein MKY34_00480 [Sporosarcina sp. FSL K6-1522]|uniref:hypothetical protein n=1 Tax=Sporosarcina sp. FSL K6-1522 TaxID=2921554 RepID=UPI00315A6E1D
MANMQLREKMKTITEAAKHGDRVPERSKNAGLIILLLLFGCGIIVLFALAIGLVINGHLISAGVTFLLAALLTFSVIKMIKADDIQ